MNPAPAPRFVNRNLEAIIHKKRVDDLQKAWSTLKKHFESDNAYYGGQLTLLTYNTSKARFFEMLPQAEDDTQALFDVMYNMEDEEVYKPLCPEEYKRQYEAYNNYSDIQVFGLSHFPGMWRQIEKRLDQAAIEKALRDALWLIETCKLDINIAAKRAPAGSYMALLKKLSNGFDPFLVVPPTYEEGNRFQVMLYLAKQIWFAEDTPAKKASPAKKRRVGDN